ncbi:type II secretion system protein [Aliidiomarina quisquiliarum]|uniref:type II secretion system protein n=1 Tax=Aliidiomarina quisquiliarum TaxID=2938947 RepID=UPI00208FCB33|nr:hypothetical protein [Aliidiomarina quisquiliarum]MCO4321767.1 hypothetical protein [Aliidiomarina quisquiliarum]
MKYQRGQALVELSLVVTVLGLFLVWALPLLHEQLLERAETQEQAQIILRQASWRDSHELPQLSFEQLQEHYGYEQREAPNVDIAVSDNYAFSAAVAPLWDRVSEGYGLAMPIRNLYSMSLTQPNEENAWFKFVRLSDDWSPRQVADLEARPRKLTTSHLFEEIGVHRLQNFLAILPFAKELHSNQLKLGYIASDVVPARAICTREPCHD